MANTTIKDLTAATSGNASDLLIVRQGSDTADKSITADKLPVSIATQTALDGKAGNEWKYYSSRVGSTKTYASGSYHLPLGSYSALTNASVVANRLKLIRYVFHQDFTTHASADSLGIQCVTGAAGCLGKFLVYSSGADGFPDALVYESPDINFSTNGYKSVVTTLNFNKDEPYWIGLWGNSVGGATVYDIASLQDFLESAGASSTGGYYALVRTATYGAAPDPFNFTRTDLSTGAAVRGFGVKVRSN